MPASNDKPRTDVLVAHQPAYLPWQGYFSRLLDVDRLVLLDHVQFSERGFQNRNWILGHGGGRQMLTVPVRRAGRFGQPINEVEIADPRWWARHWRTIEQVYGRAAYFGTLADHLQAVYRRPWTRLVELNVALIQLVLDAIGHPVRIERSSQIQPTGHKTEMLVDLCRRTGADILRTGTGAANYLDAALLAEAGITVEVAKHVHHPYPQGRPPFVPGLAALDVLLHQGPDARSILAAGFALEPWAPGPQRS